MLLELTVGAANEAAESLRDREKESGAVLAASVMRGLGFLLLLVPLVFLYYAGLGRSEKMLRNLVGLAYAGPILTGIGTILATLALAQVASDFVEGTRMSNQAAEDLIGDSGFLQVAAGMSFAGGLALVVALIYSSIWGQRTGLLTPFWGAFGVIAAVFTALPLVPVPGIVLFMLPFGLQLLGRWPGPRPPAWKTGEAIPWERGKPGTEVEPESDELPEIESGEMGEPGDQSRRKRKRRG